MNKHGILHNFCTLADDIGTGYMLAKFVFARQSLSFMIVGNLQEIFGDLPEIVWFVIGCNLKNVYLLRKDRTNKLLQNYEIV